MGHRATAHTRAQQEFTEKKKAGDTAGEEALRGDRTDEMVTDDPLSDEAKKAQGSKSQMN
jgi:hypothetical protein